MFWSLISFFCRRNGIIKLANKDLTESNLETRVLVCRVTELTVHIYTEYIRNNAFYIRRESPYIKCIVLFNATIITRCRDPPINRFVIFKNE